MERTNENEQTVVHNVMDDFLIVGLPVILWRGNWVSPSSSVRAKQIGQKESVEVEGSWIYNNDKDSKFIFIHSLYLY